MLARVERCGAFPGFDPLVQPGGRRVFAGSAPGERVYRITPDGEVETFAEGLLYGASGNAFDADGHLRATLSFPNDVALSPDGRVLYFDDVVEDTAGSSVIGPVLIRAIAL